MERPARTPVLSVIESTHTVSLIDGTDQYIFLVPADKMSSIRRIHKAIDTYTYMSSDPYGWVKRTQFSGAAPALASLVLAILMYVAVYKVGTGEVAEEWRTHIVILFPILIMAMMVAFVTNVAKVLNARSSWHAVTSLTVAEYVAKESGLSWLPYTDLVLAESIRLGDLSDDPEQNSVAAQRYSDWLVRDRQRRKDVR